MKKIHYAWLVCAGCTLLLFCTVGLATSAFSVFLPYLIREGGLTNTQGSLIITVRSMAALASMLVVGPYLRRTGLRRGAAIAAALCALSFVLFGLATGFLGYCVASTVAGVAYGLGGMIPASVLISRWFRDDRALALGICAAGSGVATVIAPPIATALIESSSLETAFLANAAFAAAAAGLVAVVLKNTPQEKGLEPFASAKVGAVLRPAARQPEAGRGTIGYALVAIVMIGAIANPGFAHLSVLYEAAGFSGFRVSLLISVVGAALTVGKCVYGRFADLMGARKSSLLFFGLLTAGQLLCCFAPVSGFPSAVAAMLLIGLGMPLSTVGLSVYAGDLSPSQEEYGKTLKHFQIAYMAGSLLFGPMPGMLADATGSYVPAYVILSAFSVAAMVLEQMSYRKKGSTHHTRPTGQAGVPCRQTA